MKRARAPGRAVWARRAHFRALCAREGKKGTREVKKGTREGKKGAAPFYFGLAGTLSKISRGIH